MKLLERIKKPAVFFPIVIVVIELLLFVANFKPGTYLIGWDNIMPEFNLKANFLRSIFSIWQEYRGLGVLDGMAHSANLFHTFYIFVISLFLPDSALRYVFIHLTHILGGIGFFFLLRKLTKNDKASFIGSLFYMLNLGIIQMYFAPLEVFATHFTALPLLALLITNALQKANPKNLFFLFLGCLLTSQQGFVPTVFIAFGILFGFILLVHLLKTKAVKTVFLVLMTVIFANAFWAFPYSYSAVNTGENIRNSKINQFSSEEIFFRNKTFGDFKSVLSLKGFMKDTVEMDPESFNDAYFMSKWRDLTSGIFYQATYLVFLVMAIFGAVLIFIKKRFEFLPFLLAFGVAFVFLANDTIIFSQINNFIRTAFPLLGEAFRFPFTKFVTLFAFCFSVLLTLGISYILSKYNKYQKLIFLCLTAGVILISYPAFLGYFTSPYLRQEIPKEYLDLFKEMKGKDPDQRVALFPLQTFWNWQYRTWGQRGSGFIWYGLFQPNLERAFDPWSPYDEQFYNEMAFAVNSQDQKLFENVINKYDIKYIILDQYILNTLSRKEINYDSLKKFLGRSAILRKEKQFGKIILYRTRISDGWIYKLNEQKTKGVFPNYSFEREDSIYGITGNYITDVKDPAVVNLFPSLLSEKLQEDLEFGVQNLRNEYVLTPKKNLPYDLKDYMLRIPSLFETEFLVPVSVSFEDGSLALTPSYPTININGADLDVSETPLIVEAETILNPARITFIETGQVIELGKTRDPKAYILNPAINSIKLEDSNGNSELIYLDTNGVPSNSFYASIPSEDYSSISISFPKLDSTQSVTKIIEDEKYEIKKIGGGIFTSKDFISGGKKGLSYIELFARDASSELTFYLPDLYHQASYILFAKNTHQSGLAMRFYIDNDTERKAEVESVFSKGIKETTVVIPKSNNYFRGYGFHFIVRSVGKEYASSILQGVEVFPFPARFVRSLQFIDKDIYQNSIEANPKMKSDYKKTNFGLYETESTKNQYLVLSQAFDQGWKAYEIEKPNKIKILLPFIFGNKLEEHILINNWANGWKTENGGKTVIVYVPIFFQFLGQFVTIGTLIMLLTLWLKKRNRAQPETPVQPFRS